MRDLCRGGVAPRKPCESLCARGPRQGFAYTCEPLRPIAEAARSGRRNAGRARVASETEVRGPPSRYSLQRFVASIHEVRVYRSARQKRLAVRDAADLGHPQLGSPHPERGAKAFDCLGIRGLIRGMPSEHPALENGAGPFAPHLAPVGAWHESRSTTGPRHAENPTAEKAGWRPDLVCRRTSHRYVHGRSGSRVPNAERDRLAIVSARPRRCNEFSHLNCAPALSTGESRRCRAHSHI